MSLDHISKLSSAFNESFDYPVALLVKAPGRINLIGEHTDYNDGYVFPAAVGQGIYVGIAKNNSDVCRLVSIDLNDTYLFDVNRIDPLPPNSWQNYILGVASEIKKAGYQISGFDMIFTGDVPRGSGMSSSAALECGTCLAINGIFDLDIPKIEMIKICQRAEHNYAGVMCGIMDQFASIMGKKDHSLLLDCSSLEYRHIPVRLNDYSILLLNSNVSHSLASSEYNVRREQCEEGFKRLKYRFSDIRSLSDVTLVDLFSMRSELPEVIFRRCKYIIEENIRVQEFADSMSKGDLFVAGQILRRAQKGMAEEYEITCPEIDFMADFANNHPDVSGARMMGGGFGGCTINLIKSRMEDQFIQSISQVYQDKFNKGISPIRIEIDNGARIIRS